MDSRLSIFILCGGKWVRNDKSEHHFLQNDQTQSSLIYWDGSNYDFNAFLAKIYLEFGLQQSKHQLKVFWQPSRLVKVFRPMMIASDMHLERFLTDPEVKSSILFVEVTAQNVCDGAVNLVFDKASGHGLDGAILNVEGQANVQTFISIGSNPTPNIPTPNIPLDNLEVVMECTQENVVDDDGQENVVVDHGQENVVDDGQENTVVDDGPEHIGATNVGVEDGQEHVGATKDDAENGHYSQFPDDFDFPMEHVDDQSGADGTFGDGSDLCIGDEFPSKADLKRKMTEIAIAGCFETKTVKSDTTRYILCCRDAKCSWMMRAFSVKDSPRFVVKKYNKVHNCAVGERKRSHRQTTSRYVGEVVLSTLGGSRELIKPKTIMTLMQNKSMPITYTKAWLGRKFANEKLYGKPCENYAKLPLYLQVLKEANHGRVYTNLEVDEDGHFKYVFIAFLACTDGFRSMRQVISVDGTFCKTLEKGVLIIATAQDGDSHQYPLAWAVVDSENNESYSYFFGHLRQVIQDHQSLVFISDRHQSIENGLRKHFTLADYGYCRYHIHCNLKGPLGKKNKDGLQLFDKLSNAYTERSFERLLREFEERFPNGARYISTIPKERWARAFFRTHRYNIMTTNGAESINSVLRHTRTLPILALLNGIQTKTAEWRGKRHTELNALEGLSSPLTPNAEANLRTRYATALKLSSMRLGEYEFQVKGVTSDHVVNLRLRTCTCRVFDLDKIPCVHALACLTDEIMKELQMNAYSLCDQTFFRTRAHTSYAETIYPVPAFDEWKGHDLELQNVKPPKTKKKRGRPQTKRIPSAGEKRKTSDLICSGCHNKGHTIRTCKEKAHDTSISEEIDSDTPPETEADNGEEL